MDHGHLLFSKWKNKFSGVAVFLIKGLRLKDTLTSDKIRLIEENAMISSNSNYSDPNSDPNSIVRHSHVCLPAFIY